MPITPGAGQYVNIYAGLTGVLPITGNVTVSGTVAVSQTNQQGMTVGAPVWVTGTVTVPGHNVQITGTITLPVSATNPVTASIANFPTTFPGNANITASITLPVSATNPVTASVSNFPAGFNANITASVTLPVSATNPVTASIDNWPTDQVVHGLVEITASIPLYVTSSAANPVYISGNITSVAVENSVGGTGTIAPASATLVGGVSGTDLVPLKVDNLGALYVTGTFATSGNSNVEITGSVPLQVTSTQANPVWVTGVMTVNTGTSGGGLVEITASIPLFVTSTLAAPIWVTGSTGGSSEINITQSITLPVSATNPVTASVSNFPTGFNANITGTITLPVSATNPVTASISNWPTTFPGNSNITASITLPVSATNPVTASISNFPTAVTATLSGGINVNITSSIPLTITSTLAAPVWVTGVLTVNTGSSVSGYGTGSAVAQNNTGTLVLASDGSVLRPFKIDNQGILAVSSTNSPVFPAGFNSNITASITLPVSATNPVTASISNFPTAVTATLSGVLSASIVQTGFNSNITASITLPVSATNPVTASIANFPVGFNANITGSITLPVSATNPITASVANWPTTFPGNVNITGSNVWLSASVVGTVPVTSTAAAPIWVTGTVTSAGGSGGGNVEITASIPLFVTSTAGLPVWVTGTLTVNTGSGGGVTGYGTGSAIISSNTGSLILGSDGTNLRAIKTDNIGTVFVSATVVNTVPVSATNPITASVSNFPVGFNANITASITLPVSATNPVTASIANFPTGQNVNITGSNVWLSASIVGQPTVTASIVQTGFNANITGSNVWLSASIVQQSGGLYVKITGTSATNADGEAVATSGYGETLAYNKVFNGTTWDRQRALGVGVTQVSSTVASPVWVTASAANRVAVGIFDATGADMDLFKDGDNLAIGADHGLGILAVADGTPRKYHFLKTDEVNNWLWVTGAMTVNTGSGGGVSGYGTGSLASTANTGSLQLGSDGTNLRAIKTDAAGQVYIANPGGSSAPTSGTNVTVSATGTVGGVLLIAANAGRKGLTIFNNASTNLYISMGTTATTASFQVMMVPNAYYEAPFSFAGPVSGAWSGTPTGNALLGEQT